MRQTFPDTGTHCARINICGQYLHRQQDSGQNIPFRINLQEKQSKQNLPTKCIIHSTIIMTDATLLQDVVFYI